MSVNVEFSGPLSAAAAVSALSSAPGVLVSDNGTGAPTALEGAGIDPVLVGRVRDDLSQANTLNLWVTGDNLRKGAALNAVQLAEIVVAE
jgi:aspartate-semialdehyde dehydrogenase